MPLCRIKLTAMKRRSNNVVRFGKRPKVRLSSPSLLRSPFAVLFLVFVAVVSWLVTEPQPEADAQSTSYGLAGDVVRVIDGDTFVLADGTRIRVWGLDAPERDEAGGSAATEALGDLILGHHVSCEDMGKSYNRTVGRCLLEDGTDPAAEMIRLGVSTQYCRFSRGYYDEVSASPC